jgi:hypothetical protein
VLADIEAGGGQTPRFAADLPSAASIPSVDATAAGEAVRFVGEALASAREARADATHSIQSGLQGDARKAVGEARADIFSATRELRWQLADGMAAADLPGASRQLLDAKAAADRYKGPALAAAAGAFALAMAAAVLGGCSALLCPWAVPYPGGGLKGRGAARLRGCCSCCLFLEVIPLSQRLF